MTLKYKSNKNIPPKLINFHGIKKSTVFWSYFLFRTWSICFLMLPMLSCIREKPFSFLLHCNLHCQDLQRELKLYELYWKCESLSRVWLFATPWTVACQALLSMKFFRQEYWSGQPFPSPDVSLLMSDGMAGTSLVVQWLRLLAPNAGGPGSIPDQGTRLHMPQQRWNGRAEIDIRKGQSPWSSKWGPRASS